MRLIKYTDPKTLIIAYLGEDNFYGLGSGSFILWLIAVGAYLVGDDLNGFFTDSSGDVIAEFLGDDYFDGQFNIVAFGGNGGSAYFSLFDDINDGAVVFGLFITITTISWGMMPISWGRVSISRGGVGVAWLSSHEWKESNKGENLKNQMAKVIL